MDKNVTPRTLIRAVQKDLSKDESPPNIYRDRNVETKDLLKAFIGADTVVSKAHKKLLEHPAFHGCHPRIVDQVFRLERLSAEMSRFEAAEPQLNIKPEKQQDQRKPVNVLKPNAQYSSLSPAYFTGFEHCLICVNITLLIGIIMTVIILGLFFLFLNNALNLKEDIS